MLEENRHRRRSIKLLRTELLNENNEHCSINLTKNSILVIKSKNQHLETIAFVHLDEY